MFKPVVVDSRMIERGEFRLPPAHRIILEEVPPLTRRGKATIEEVVIDTVLELNNISQQTYEVIILTNGIPQHYCIKGGSTTDVPFGQFLWWLKT